MSTARQTRPRQGRRAGKGDAAEAVCGLPPHGCWVRAEHARDCHACGELSLARVCPAFARGANRNAQPVTPFRAAGFFHVRPNGHHFF